MKTFTGKEINKETRGILYLCNYNREEQVITVLREIQFISAFDALQAFANIPNPESQMASGKDKEAFEKDLSTLHTNLNNPEWVEQLSDYI